MPNPPLDIGNGFPGIEFVPAPIEVLGDHSKLNDQIAGQVLRIDLAALSRHNLSSATSSLPMMIRASEPPMKLRLLR